MANPVTYIWYSPVTTSHTRNLSRVVPRVIQREDKICHAWVWIFTRVMLLVIQRVEKNNHAWIYIFTRRIVSRVCAWQRKYPRVKVSCENKYRPVMPSRALTGDHFYTTVPLNYNFIFTRLHAWCHACFAWRVPKFTVEILISTWRAVAFPREDSWHYTTHGISTRRIVEFPRNESWRLHAKIRKTHKKLCRSATYGKQHVASHSLYSTKFVYNWARLTLYVHTGRITQL